MNNSTECRADEQLAETPLAATHREAGASMCPFAGYAMPVHYGSIIAEHRACREAAVLFDVSHMGRLRFEGAEAADFLDHVLTRRVGDSRTGQVRYSLICNEKGGVLDDVLVSHIATPAGADYFLMVVNAANRAKILQWLERQLADFPGVTMTDRTELSAMIALQGPRSLDVLKGLVKSDVSRLGRYKTVVSEQFGKPVIVSRTGYTGEDGFELIVRVDHATRIWENLLLAGRDCGIQPAGLGARDTLRLEAGMPLYGHELDESIDPVTAGLEFAVSFDDRSFVGGEALGRIRAAGPERRRVGLVIDGRRPARESARVLDESDAEIGWVTSGTSSPTLNKPIAMAYVSATHAAVDTRLRVDIRGKHAGATVVPLPFYSR